MCLDNTLVAELVIPTHRYLCLERTNRVDRPAWPFAAAELTCSTGKADAQLATQLLNSAQLAKTLLNWQLLNWPLLNSIELSNSLAQLKKNRYALRFCVSLRQPRNYVCVRPCSAIVTVVYDLNFLNRRFQGFWGKTCILPDVLA
jgi:hypothetical protein